MGFVRFDTEGAVGIVTIDRPKALNALNSEVLAELDACFDSIDTNTIRAVILTGEGDKSFVAGADIGEMSKLSPAEGEAFGKKGNDVFRKIETFPVPVIAAVNGFALGGGCEIAMSCDIRICSDNAMFGQPEVGLGITPGFGGTQRLARIVGVGMAKQLIYTAKTIKAEEDIEAVDFEGNKLCVVYKNTSEKFNHTLYIYSKTGDVILKKEFLGDFSNLDMQKGYIYLTKDDKAIIMNTAGVIKYSGSLDSNIHKIVKRGLLSGFTILGDNDFRGIVLK